MKVIYFSGKEKSGIKYYFFSGPGVTNVGQRSTSQIYQRALNIIPEIFIENEIRDLDNLLEVTFTGHSRSGSVCVDVYNKILATYKGQSNLKISIVPIGDPYKGDQEVAKISKNSPGSNIQTDKTVVVYAAKTKIGFTPQQIVGSDIIVILNVDHSNAARPLENLPEGSGLFVAEIDTEDSSRISEYHKIQKDDPSSIERYFNFIKTYGRVTQTGRWRFFVTILIERLKMTYDDIVEKVPKVEHFPDVEKEVNSVLDGIKKSSNLISAFKLAMGLFEKGGIFYGWAGSTFDQNMTGAKEAVCGKGHDDFQAAVAKLQNIKDKPGRNERSVKYMVADALIARINEKYPPQH